jgi:hypothetical protein
VANYRRVARRAANRYGIDPQIFERQIQQESGFNPGARSGAGAQGIAQIMPATAAGWGVNPNNPRQALNAAAAHMAQYLKSYHGSWSKALTAYNAGPGRVGGHLPAETQNYIKTILGGKGEVRNSGTPGLAPTSRSWNEPTFDQAGFTADKRKAILGQMIAKSNPNSILLKSGLLTTELPNEADYSGSKRVTKHIPGVPGIPGDNGGDPYVGAHGHIKITGANPGRIVPEVRHFMRALSSVSGQTIVGDSGATHSKMTVNGNVSEHYTGHATDIPASGSSLTKLGQDALIAAGWSPARARKTHGGLFNVMKGGRRYQIIFNTNEGGNHFNHLHVGVH